MQVYEKDRIRELSFFFEKKNFYLCFIVKFSMFYFNDINLNQ